MKKYKVAIQKGLNEIFELLKNEGYDVVSYEDYDGDADITIISGIDSEYEEIETTQCRVCGPNDKQMLLIDATRLTPEKVLEYVKTIRC